MEFTADNMSKWADGMLMAGDVYTVESVPATNAIVVVTGSTRLGMPKQWEKPSTLPDNTAIVTSLGWSAYRSGFVISTLLAVARAMRA
jgi:hypothetical protein